LPTAVGPLGAAALAAVLGGATLAGAELLPPLLAAGGLADVLPLEQAETITAVTANAVNHLRDCICPPPAPGPRAPYVAESATR
jgi:hypothetical protein